MQNKLKKILGTAAIGICALAMPFGLVGCFSGQDIDLRVKDGYVQWQVEGEEKWDNLFSVMK